MEIKTTRHIFNMDDLNSELTGNEGQKQYLDFMDKKWVDFNDILESLKEITEHIYFLKDHKSLCTNCEVCLIKCANQVHTLINKIKGDDKLE